MVQPKDHDLVTGTFFQRALKSLVERFAQKSGQKVVAAGWADTLFGKIKAVVGEANVDKVFEMLVLVAPVILQDPFLWRLVSSWFGLPPAMASELTNEGLDEFLVSFFDAAKAAKDKPENTHGSLFAKAADKAASDMEDEIKRRHPQLFEDCVVEEERKLIHKLGCPIVNGMPKTVTMKRWEARQKAVPALQCVCVGFEADLPSNLNQARNRLTPDERQQFRDMLESDPFEKVRMTILEKGGRATNITTADLRNLLGYKNPEMQRDELLALVGVGKRSEHPIVDQIRGALDTLGIKLGPSQPQAAPVIGPPPYNRGWDKLSTAEQLALAADDADED